MRSKEIIMSFIIGVGVGLLFAVVIVVAGYLGFCWLLGHGGQT